MDEVLGISPLTLGAEAHWLRLLSSTSCAGRYLLTEDACPYVLPPDIPLCSHLLLDHLDWSHASVTPSDLVDHIARAASEPEHFSTVLSLGLSLHKVMYLTSSNNIIVL